MSDHDEPTPESTSDDPSAQAPEDAAQLAAERDALALEVERLKDKPASKRRVRKVVAVLLIVVSAVSLAGLMPGLWVRRSLADTDRYLSIVGQLPQDPAVAEALARTLTAQVFTALDVQQKLSTALQSRLPEVAFLAGPITTSIESFTRDQVQALIQSDVFDRLWIEANTLLQETLIDVLHGDSESLTIGEDGSVTLNLLPIVNAALGKVSGVASSLTGHTVTLPTVTADTVPSEAISRIESTLGVDLPDNFGQVVIYQSDELAEVQAAVAAFEQALFIAVGAFILATIGAIWVSPRRRRTLIQLAVVWAVVLVIERRLMFVFTDRLVDHAKPENQKAVRSIVDAILDGFKDSTSTLLQICFLIIVIALITGPYGWARSMRETVAGAARSGYGLIRHPETARWVGRHRDGLMALGAVVGVVVLLLANFGFIAFLIWSGLVAAYLIGVYVIGLRTAADRS